MGKLEFRTLEAYEIDCRVATAKENGLSLLLYKDARVDQNILDETVGAFNWQRHHSRENANCIVAIWDKEKKQWIEKEDTGKESNTEAEKGLASDSFKRACFNWGIGRELYSAPFIWIKAEDANITKGNKGNYQCYDKFAVQQILYDENRNIVALSIWNVTKGKRVFLMDKRKGEVQEKPETEKKPEVNQNTKKKAEPSQKKIENSVIDEVKVKALLARCDKESVDPAKILKLYKVNSIADLTEVKYANINEFWDRLKEA